MMRWQKTGERGIWERGDEKRRKRQQKKMKKGNRGSRTES